MIDSVLPIVSSRAKPRDLHSRRKNGEYEIAWKTGKPVELSGKNADVQERSLDFARNDDTEMKKKPSCNIICRTVFVPLARERQPDRRSPPCGCPTADATAARRSHSPPHTAHHSLVAAHLMRVKFRFFTFVSPVEVSSTRICSLISTSVF